MVKTLTILFVLMLASVVQAQALVVRVTETSCNQNSCQQIIGTGACAYIGNIDDRSVYITAAHNVNQAKTVHVGYAGQWWGARVVHKRYQDGIDYAIIETQKIDATRCFAVAENQPANGAEAVAYGYPNGVETVRVLRAKIRVGPNGRVFSKIVAKGDSGGPIVVNGQVVGIIKGHDYSNTIYTDGVLIRQQLIQQYGRLPSCGSEPPVIVDVEDPENPTINSEQVAALEVQIGLLKAEIDKLNKTQIPVWIMDADGKPIAKQTYPLGDPIKLRFKAVKPSEAK